MPARASRIAFTLLALAAAAAAQITPGNLLVLRVGDGTAALGNAATAVWLDEYTQAGAFVQSVALPVANTGVQRAVTCSGTATSEGGLTQSVDGRYFVVAGYGANLGTAAIASTSSSSAPRICARIALDETIDTTTALGDAYSQNNFRSACSWFGQEFWTAGTATSTNGPGVRFAAALGATTSTQLDPALLNIRRVDLFGGQLYCTLATGSFFGVATVGSGTPTAPTATISLLPGFPIASGPSPYDFFFADAHTLYVADDRTTGAGGIQKWTLTGPLWTLQYTFSPGSGVGCRGLTGFVDGGVSTLFATTTSNLLVKVTDTGSGASVLPLVLGATNTAWRGIRFVRTPASITYSGLACPTTVGSPALGTGGGEPLAGNSSFQIVADNTPGGALVLFSLALGQPSVPGLPIPGAPACVAAYVLPTVLRAGISDPFGSCPLDLPLPAGAALGGTRIAAQGFVLDAGLPNATLPLGQTSAMQIVVGN